MSATPMSPPSQRSSNWRPRLFRGDILWVSLAMHLLSMALPLALLQIYDRILPAQAYGTAVFLILGVGLAIVLEAVLRYGRQALFANIGARYEAQVTMAALDRLQHADLATLEKRGSTSISDALRAIAQVRDFWSGQAGAALYELPFVWVYIALIAYVGGWLALIPLALFVLALGLAWLLNPQIQDLAVQSERAQRERQDLLWSIFGALPYLKAIGAELSLAPFWRSSTQELMVLNAELEARLSWVRENASAIGQLATILVVAFGATQVMEGQFTTGALAACTMLAGRSIGPAMASLGFLSQRARLKEAQLQVDALLNLEDAPRFSPQAPGTQARLGISAGALTIDAPDLLQGPVHIAPGEIVHLQTEDAQAASRLLSAIAGLSDDEGIRVQVDGHNPGAYSHDEYRRSVALVTRHLALVPGSILNNLTLYNANLNAELEPLSQALGLQAHIDRLKHGLLTDVGPGNAEHIDEGVYQRIALVRALLGKPRILLLDHAACGIDLDGIKRLADQLRSMQGNSTVLIATYKEPLIAACTRSLPFNKKGVA